MIIVRWSHGQICEKHLTEPRIGIDICRALACCHERGIIHRDVKPQNVFWSKFGEYKLGDFGIARKVEQTSKSIYSRKGTVPYMAPEVFRGEKYGKNADIYSLGIMLYRYLNNMRSPFLPPAPQSITTDDMEQASSRRLRGDDLPAPSEADDVLATIVLRACQSDPRKRYQSAREFMADLSSWREGRCSCEGDARGTKRQEVPESSKQQERELRNSLAPTVIDRTEPEVSPAKGRKSRRILLIAFSIALVMFAAIAMVLMLSSGESQRTSGSEYVGEWYVPTDTDRHIRFSENGDVSYGDDRHGTIASGEWSVIDEGVGAIKLTLKAQSGNEKMFEEGSGVFTRMVYAESAERLTAQLYYSPSEWETYIKGE